MVRRCETATLLAVHAALGQRWVCLPLAVLWVTGSVPVAYSFAGQFAAWALLVLVADCCAALHLVGSVPIHTSSSRLAGRAGATAIACMAILIACCVPIVWRGVAVSTAVYIVAACALAARKRHPAYLFFAWALAESLLGAGVGCGLYFTRTLYSDQMDNVTPGWRWLVLLYGVNCALGIVSAVVQALVVLNMFNEGLVPRASYRVATRSKVNALPGSMALLPMGVGQQPACDDIEEASSVHDGESTDEMQDGTRTVSWRSCNKIGLLAWSGMLLFLTLGWLAMQLFPPGEPWPDPPACSLDCFCKPLAGSQLFNAESPQQQHADNNNGVQILRNLPFGEALLRRQNLRVAECNPNRSPCLNPFGNRPPAIEDTVTLHLDLYRPRAWAGVDQGGQHPAIVLAHPGGFSRGAKNSTIIAAEAAFFAQHGFIAVAIDYRLEAASFLPEDGSVRDAIADTKAAVRWLRRNKQLYGVDSERIALWGASAGGIIAGHSPVQKCSEVLLLQVCSCLVRLLYYSSAMSCNSHRCKSDGIGTIGFAHIRGELSSSNDAYSSRVAAAVAVSGCLWPSILGEGDASRIAEKDAVPYLDIHGDADVQVGTWDSLFTYKYLESLGVPSENNRLVIVPGGGHVPWGDVEKERLRPVVMDFLIRQLHLDDAECNGV